MDLVKELMGFQTSRIPLQKAQQRYQIYTKANRVSPYLFSSLTIAILAITIRWQKQLHPLIYACVGGILGFTAYRIFAHRCHTLKNKYAVLTGLRPRYTASNALERDQLAQALERTPLTLTIDLIDSRAAINSSLIHKELSENKNETPIKRLPSELINIVSGYLDIRSTCRLAQVSKQWRDYMNKDSIWKQHVQFLIPRDRLTRIMQQDPSLNTQKKIIIAQLQRPDAIFKHTLISFEHRNDKQIWKVYVHMNCLAQQISDFVASKKHLSPDQIAVSNGSVDFEDTDRVLAGTAEGEDVELLCSVKEP